MVGEGATCECSPQSKVLTIDLRAYRTLPTVPILLQPLLPTHRTLPIHTRTQGRSPLLLRRATGHGALPDHVQVGL